MNSKMRLAQAQLGACVGVLTLTIGYCLVQLPRLEETAEQANAKAGRTQTQVEALSGTQQKLVSGLDEANRRLIALGKSPVPVPKVVSPDEFTAEEAAAVRLIVADQIARAKTPITQAEISQIAKAAAALIPKPADGKSPTPAQMQTYAKVAVASYCLEDRCVRQPKDGKDGDPAPKVTDEELLRAAQTALAAYCAQEEKPCTPKDGVDGKDGSDGARGATGRGIADMDCQADGSWLIYYTDGTTDTARGPCRVVVAPSSTETK